MVLYRDTDPAVRWLARGMHQVPESSDWLAPAERCRLQTLRFPKRRIEVRLARWAAKQAVARALDLRRDHGTLAKIEIRAASSGAPGAFVAEAPAPLAVSLTDRADWAVCVVAPRDVAVGCDLELVEERSEVFVRDWFTSTEQDLVFGAGGEDRALLSNLVWSAKESALKVLETGLRRDTRSVEVAVTAAGGDRWAELAVRTEEGRRFSGWWRRYGDFLLTVVSDAAVAPPVSLEDPPHLADAVPSHRWLTETSP